MHEIGHYQRQRDQHRTPPNCVQAQNRHRAESSERDQEPQQVAFHCCARDANAVLPRLCAANTAIQRSVDSIIGALDGADADFTHLLGRAVERIATTGTMVSGKGGANGGKDRTGDAFGYFRRSPKCSSALVNPGAGPDDDEGDCENGDSHESSAFSVGDCGARSTPADSFGERRMRADAASQLRFAGVCRASRADVMKIDVLQRQCRGRGRR